MPFASFSAAFTVHLLVVIGCSHSHWLTGGWFLRLGAGGGAEPQDLSRYGASPYMAFSRPCAKARAGGMSILPPMTSM